MQTLEQELFVFCKAKESDTKADAGKLMQVSYQLDRMTGYF